MRPISEIIRIECAKYLSIVSKACKWDNAEWSELRLAVDYQHTSSNKTLQCSPLCVADEATSNSSNFPPLDMCVSWWSCGWVMSC